MVIAVDAYEIWTSHFAQVSVMAYQVRWLASVECGWDCLMFDVARKHVLYACLLVSTAQVVAQTFVNIAVTRSHWFNQTPTRNLSHHFNFSPS